MRANFVMSGVTEGLRRNLLMTIALVLTTAVSLSFVAAAILTGVEISRFRTHYEDKLSVALYLCQDSSAKSSAPNGCTTGVTPSQLSALRTKLSSDPRVKSYTFVSEEQAYKDGLATLPPAEAQYLQVGDLPSSFTIKLKDIKKDYPGVAQDYGKASGVYSIQNEDDSIKTILQLFNGALVAAIVSAAVILLCAIIMIAITIQVAAAQRRNETSIMRLVGASRLMTQLPFVIEAVIGAAVGGLLAIVVAWGGKYYLLNNLLKNSVRNQVIPDLGVNDILVAGGASLIAGIVLAALTAYATLRLYVRL
jgi:cell division transport system permease protein